MASPRDDFDMIVLGSVDRLRSRFDDDLDGVEVAVQDVPLLPGDFDGRIPLAGLAQPSTASEGRIVLFRLPISRRTRGRQELEDLVFSLIVEQLAALWDRDVDEIDPR